LLQKTAAFFLYLKIILIKIDYSDLILLDRKLSNGVDKTKERIYNLGSYGRNLV